MSVKQHKRQIALGLIVLGVLLIVVWGTQTVVAGLSLLRSLREVQTLLAGDPWAADVEALGTLLRHTRRDVVTLQRNIGWLVGAGNAFRRLPVVGPGVAQAPALLALADGLTEAGVLVWDAVEPSLILWQADGSVLERVPDVVTRLMPILPRAQVAVTRAREAYATLDISTMPERLQKPLAQLGTLLPLLDDGLALAEIAPTLLGLETPRTYLLLALNEDELRPGGGFVTGAGEIHMAGGKIISMTFQDSYAADNFKQPYPPAPEPLRQFMGIDLLVFRDGNWSPDFPTAARLLLTLYRPPHPVAVDGLIAMDQFAVQRMVKVLEPLSLPDWSAPVTAATLFNYIYSTWAPADGKMDSAWWKQHKSFIGPLVEAAMTRLAGGDVNWTALAKALQELLAQKHLQVYLTDPRGQALLAARRWSGGVQTPAGDYALIVEANLSYNKASRKLERAFTYAVDLTQHPPRATMTLTYTHTSTVDIACLPEARYDPEYTQMMDRCYWGYLRLYVPQGAQLVEASRHPIPAESIASGQPWDGAARVTAAPEGAFSVFEQAMLLPTASQVTLHFTYLLPENVIRQNADGTFTYRLLWQKQAGLSKAQARLILRLPQNTVLCPPQIHPGASNAGAMIYTLDARVDQEISICYMSQEGGK